MAAELESLAGKLNFITQVVLAGRSFTKRVYQSFQGIPKHRHIDLKQLRMGGMAAPHGDMDACTMGDQIF